MGDCERCKKGQGILFDVDYGLVCRKCWKQSLRESEEKIRKEVQS